MLWPHLKAQRGDVDGGNDLARAGGGPRRGCTRERVAAVGRLRVRQSGARQERHRGAQATRATPLGERAAGRRATVRPAQRLPNGRPHVVGP